MWIHFLVDPGLSANPRTSLREMVERQGGRISFWEIPRERVAGLPTMDRIGVSMWYRILLPDLLPEVDRVLYLDVDTLVLDSLGPLWETDLGENYLGAVTNVLEQHRIKHPVRLGLADPTQYFNSGVLLMNLGAMRRDGCAETLHRFAIEHADKLLWPDQDALNLILGERRLPLHPRWNLTNAALDFPWSAYVLGARELDEARRSPGVRHFEGPAGNKPWHLLCDRDMRELYEGHRRGTPWPELELEGVTLVNRTRRAVRAGRAAMRPWRRRAQRLRRSLSA